MCSVDSWQSFYDVTFSDFEGICHSYDRFLQLLKAFEVSTNSRFVHSQKRSGFFVKGTVNINFYKVAAE